MRLSALILLALALSSCELRGQPWQLQTDNLYYVEMCECEKDGNARSAVLE